MKAILNGWNVMRIVRLILGVAILVQGIVAKDTLTIILGIFLGGTAVANVGCCGANGCAINTPSTKKTNNTLYEELDTKK
jgi:hypothetical protein